jgi:hypothetical protein
MDRYPAVIYPARYTPISLTNSQRTGVGALTMVLSKFVKKSKNWPPTPTPERTVCSFMKTVGSSWFLVESTDL